LTKHTMTFETVDDGKVPGEGMSAQIMDAGKVVQVVRVLEIRNLVEEPAEDEFEEDVHTAHQSTHRKGFPCTVRGCARCPDCSEHDRRLQEG
jgi:hypothetical protein